MYAVIMAGGQGTRLWPKSRKKNPKQLQSLVGEKSLIQETFDRLVLITDPKKIIVSTTPEYLADMKNHLPELPKENFIVEPYPMGTAAACGLVSKVINLRDRESTVAFFPSDHNIKKPEQFAKTLKYAEGICDKFPEHILTIGIKPTRPDTGLGYIEVDSVVEKAGNSSTYKAKRFVEKPDQKTAEEYLATEKYFWNAGMFVWKTKHILKLFKQDLPQTYQVLEKIAEHVGKKDFETVLRDVYKKCDDTSIDYGIMEKSEDILVIPADFGWSDIGSWGILLEALSEIGGADVVSRGNHLGVNDSNTLVMAGDKLIATVGLENVVIVDTPDAILVCNAKKDHEVKNLINKLKEQNKHEYL